MSEMLILSLVELLVIRYHISCLSSCSELLDTLSVSQYLFSIEGATIGEARRECTSPRCEYDRVSTGISQLSGRLSSSCACLRVSREASE